MITEGIGSSSRLRTMVCAVLAMTLLGVLFAGTADAQTLTKKRAKAMAENLVDQQLADRDRRIIEARISKPRRVNRRVIRFLYDDLNRQGVVCTGQIQVRRTGLRFRAAFRATDCEQPGDEVLAFRAQARVAGRRLVRKAASVRRSVRRYNRSLNDCEDLRIPDDRADEVSLLLSAGLTQATTRPLWGTLDDYSKTLQALDVEDTDLAAGAGAWRDYNNRVRALPRLEGGYCAALVRWSRSDYSDATAPVDFAALRSTGASLRLDGATVRRTARYLRRSGIDPLTVNAFTLDGLIGSTTITEGGTN